MSKDTAASKTHGTVVDFVRLSMTHDGSYSIPSIYVFLHDHLLLPFPLIAQLSGAAPAHLTSQQPPMELN